MTAANKSNQSCQLRLRLLRRETVPRRSLNLRVAIAAVETCIFPMENTQDMKADTLADHRLLPKPVVVNEVIPTLITPLLLTMLNGSDTPSLYKGRWHMFRKQNHVLHLLLERDALVFYQRSRFTLSPIHFLPSPRPRHLLNEG